MKETKVNKHDKTIILHFLKLLVISVHQIHVGKARPRHDDNRKALVKYSIFAWITPAVIVITCVTLDKTNTVIIGYGELNYKLKYDEVRC